MALVLPDHFAEKILEAVRATNGPAEFSNDKEAYGFLNVNEYLLVPEGFRYNHDYVAKADVNIATMDVNAYNPAAYNSNVSIINQDKKIALPNSINGCNAADLLIILTALNLSRLPNTKSGHVGAILRATLCLRGMCLPLTDSGFGDNKRNVYQDEVTVVPWADLVRIPVEDWNRAITLVADDSMKVIFKKWHVVLSILAYVFVTRGHHFQGDDEQSTLVLRGEDTQGRYTYGGLYRAVWNACFPGEEHIAEDLKVVYRTALHPFGIYVAWMVLKKFSSARKLPTGLLVRASPSPAGTAKVTTGSAILRMVMGSPYFASFRDRIEKVAHRIINVSIKIMADPTRYHQTARIFNAVALTEAELKDLKDATEDASGLAPFLQGYIEAECEEAPITKQKTLRKPADDQAGLKKRVVRMFISLGERAESAEPENVMPYILPSPRVEEIGRAAPGLLGPT